MNKIYFITAFMSVDYVESDFVPEELIKGGNHFKDEATAIKALQEIRSILKKYAD